MGEIISIVLVILSVLNFICAVFLVFFERKNPGVIWAWLMVLAFLPFCGFLIYFVFGFEGRKHIKFMLKARSDGTIFDEIRNTCFEAAEDNPQKNIAILNENSSGGQLYYDNSVRIFNEGSEKFKALFEDIEKAEKFIHLQYYIIHDDKLGCRLIDALAKKASQGVEVRLFYDGMGNIFNGRKFCKKLIDAGGYVAVFQPPRWIRLNYRNHRKIALFDGKVGYVGGVNVGDEYVSQSRRFGYWRDSHIRIEGKAVRELEMRFIADWNFASKNKITDYAKYYTDVQSTGHIPMQIVSSGPDCKWNSIQYGYLKMINIAKKRLYITTPYFVPDDSILEALKVAALSGVDVRIIFPAKPDHPFVYWSSLAYMGELLDAGVRCFEYTRGFTHAKLMCVDGKICSVGTANMDIRSFKLNFEVNAFIYSSQVTESFERQFEDDFNFSNEITAEIYNKRSLAVKIKEAFARLVSPLL